MRALITGVTGFVGTYLAARLAHQGDEVLGISRSATWRAGLDEYPWLQSVAVLPWDITQAIPSTIARRVHAFRPDVIFHLAAISIPADCGVTEPTSEAYETNVSGTGRVIELTLSLPVPPALMLASSCHVYGTPQGDLDVLDESAPLRPENGYGQTKLAAEQLVAESVAKDKLRAWTVRGFQQTGPLQSDRMLLPEWARQFAAGQPIVKVRALETTLDLMDVRDAAHIYAELARRAIHSSALTGRTLNVGTGIRRSGTEIIDLLCEVSGYRPTIQESSPGVRRNPIACIDQLLKTLDVPLNYSLRDTVKNTYDYWKSRAQETPR